MRESDASDNLSPEDTRVYYLVCRSCRSRLEVKVHLAGRTCRCPTCGIDFHVPDLAALREARTRARTLEVGRIGDERVAPHAYAADGAHAPEVVVADDRMTSVIRCRRCGTINGIEANACRSCGIPFTIEAGTVEPAGLVSGWAMLSLVFGVLSVVVYYAPIVAAMAVAAGLMAVRGLYVQYGTARRLAAWSGIALGGLSTAAWVIQNISRLLP